MKTTVTTTKTVTVEEVIKHLEEHYGGRMMVGRPYLSNAKHYQFRHQEKTDDTKPRLEWEPDGETPPPSQDAFLKWAEGKVVERTGDAGFRPLSDVKAKDAVHVKGSQGGIPDSYGWIWEERNWAEVKS